MKRAKPVLKKGSVVITVLLCCLEKNIIFLLGWRACYNSEVFKSFI